MARATVLKRFELSPEAAASLEAYAKATGQSQTAIVERSCLNLADILVDSRTPASPDVQTDSKPSVKEKRKAKPTGSNLDAVETYPVSTPGLACPHLAKFRVGKKCTACGVSL